MIDDVNDYVIYLIDDLKITYPLIHYMSLIKTQYDLPNYYIYSNQYNKIIGIISQSPEIIIFSTPYKSITFSVNDPYQDIIKPKIMSMIKEASELIKENKGMIKWQT